MRPGARYSSFRAEDIFIRDDWTCGICGKPVRRKVTFPHPDSPSIDHIIPLRQGGEHAPHNVCCTHLRCNQKKGKTTQATLPAPSEWEHRFGDADRARSRHLIRSSYHTVRALLEQNHQVLRGYSVCDEMIDLVHVGVCKNSVTRNGRTQLEECGVDSLIGMLRHFGYAANGTVIRVIREILTALNLIRCVNATWSPRTYNQCGRCQRWVPTGQSWSLPFLQRVNSDELTSAQQEARADYIAGQERRHRPGPAATSASNSQYQGTTEAQPYSLNTWDGAEGIIYDPFEHSDEVICTNRCSSGYAYIGSIAPMPNDDLIIALFGETEVLKLYEVDPDPDPAYCYADLDECDHEPAPAPAITDQCKFEYPPNP